MPYLRAVGESGTTYDDPSEDVLYELLADIERGDEQFVIVERPDDASGQTYIQVIRLDDGRWLVEQRDGSVESHRAMHFADLREAHAVIARWAFPRP